MIESGTLVLTADEKNVFTPGVLRGLEKFDEDTHPTLQQLTAYHKVMASLTGAQQVAVCCGQGSKRSNSGVQLLG